MGFLRSRQFFVSTPWTSCRNGALPPLPDGRKSPMFLPAFSNEEVISFFAWKGKISPAFS